MTRTGKGQQSPADQPAYEPQSRVRYDWGMLALSWLLYFSFSFTLASLFPIVGAIKEDLGLTYAEAGIVLGSWQLVYLFAAIPVGLCVDRFQPKGVLFAGALLVAGSQFARSFAVDFPSLVLAVALLGVGGPVISVGLPKVIAEWFDGRPRALASGIYMTGAHVGQMVALALTSFLTVQLQDSWRTTLRIYAAVVIINAVIWFVLAKPSPRRQNPELAPNALQGMWAVARIRGLWPIVAVGFSGFLASHGYRSWLPELLSDKGMSPTTAGLVAAIPAFCGIVGSIVIVRFGSGRRHRAVIIGLLVIVGASMLVAAAATGPLLLASVIVEGFCAAALIPMMMNRLMGMPEVGPKYMGAAAGIYFSVGEMGGFVGPSVMGLAVGLTGSFLTGIAGLSLTMWCMIWPAYQLSAKTKTETQRQE
jgi:predicted MFS family arabinose efflux permease